MDEYQQPGLFVMAGPLGALAVFVGLAVLAAGVAVAVMRGRRRHALALFAAAWLPLPIAFAGRALGDIAAFREIAQLGPAVTPKDLASGLQYGSATTAIAHFALLLGLTGAVAALSRSREDGAAEA
jgi:hypothetical protein